jgi:YHS domain-containing protein
MAAGHDHLAMVGVSEERQADLEAQPWSQKLRSKGAWADAASYTMADLTMLRKELVVGYVVAGFLTVLVPNHVWNAVFIHGHGIWTSVENVVVGPFIALISFVCSVGNVPLAAALWKGGISFGGVISFVFADLITFPLLLICRKYYGTALTVRLLLLFWAVMAAAGLIVEGLFSVARLIPSHLRSPTIVATRFQWNYTTFLNVAFLALLALLYWLYRNRERHGGGIGYALDPVCGMQVRTADAPARSSYDGERFWFCSDHCRDRFDSEPVRYNQPDRSAAVEDAGGTTDPVCGMTVDAGSAPASRLHDGRKFSFCGKDCAEAFDADAARYSTGPVASEET